MNAAFDCICMTNVGQNARESVSIIPRLTPQWEDETFYMEVLKENAQEYEKSIQDFSDGSDIG